MADVAALDAILHELEAAESVEHAILVSRSGMHIAGTVPTGAHPETFVAMFAILLGAAETATSELKERLESVVINMGEGKIVIANGGPKAILVLRAAAAADARRIAQNLGRYVPRLQEYL